MDFYFKSCFYLILRENGLSCRLKHFTFMLPILFLIFVMLKYIFQEISIKLQTSKEILFHPIFGITVIQHFLFHVLPFSGRKTIKYKKRKPFLVVESYF